MRPIAGTITDPNMDALVAPKEEVSVSNMTREDLEVDFLRQQRRLGLLERKLGTLEETAEGRLDVIRAMQRDLDRLGLDLRRAREDAKFWKTRFEDLDRSLD